MVFCSNFFSFWFKQSLQVRVYSLHHFKVLPPFLFPIEPFCHFVQGTFYFKNLWNHPHWKLKKVFNFMVGHLGLGLIMGTNHTNVIGSLRVRVIQNDMAINRVEYMSFFLAKCVGFEFSSTHELVYETINYSCNLIASNIIMLYF